MDVEKLNNSAKNKKTRNRSNSNLAIRKAEQIAPATLTLSFNVRIPFESPFGIQKVKRRHPRIGVSTSLSDGDPS